jgi:hypothetical protein
MSGGGPLDGEAIGGEQVGEAVGHCAAVAGVARDGDEVHGRVQQAPPVHGRAESVRKG